VWHTINIAGSGMGVMISCSRFFYTTIPPDPELLSSLCRILFPFPNTPSRAKILANPASRVAIKSRFPSRHFAFYRIPRCILAKPQIPAIPFQTLVIMFLRDKGFTDIKIKDYLQPEVTSTSFAHEYHTPKHE